MVSRQLTCPRLRPSPFAQRTWPRTCRLGSAVLAAWLATWPWCGATGLAGDWPQVLGPQRNGQATGERLLSQWPEGGPRQLWAYPLGSGYAGPAVANGKVVVFHRRGDQQLLEALDPATGKPLWKASVPTRYRASVNPDDGPRCVPLISGGRVFAFGPDGKLVCVDLASGKQLWLRDLHGDYSAGEGYFGAGSSPIMIGQRLLVNVGGEGAAVVGLDPQTGKTVWKTFDDEASYASPSEVTVSGRPVAVFVTRLHLLGLEPATGKVLFEQPFGRRGPTVNAATPLAVPPNRLFVTAAYGVGCRMLDLKGGSPQLAWGDDRTLSSQYTTSVFHRGHLYGTHGREDTGPKTLRCVNADTGKVSWSREDFGITHAILAGDQLVLLDVESGRLSVGPADSSAPFQAKLSAMVARASCRALPALSQGRLLVRENSGARGRLVCLQIGE